MLRGWLDGGLETEARRRSSNRKPSPAIAALAAERGLALNPPPRAGGAEVLFLAIKPQTLDDAAPGAPPSPRPETLVVSDPRRQTIADLAARLPKAPRLRAGDVEYARRGRPRRLGRRREPVR